MMSGGKDCEAASRWAEQDMTLKPGSATALRAEAATQHGRELLARAMHGGRRWIRLRL